MTETCEHKLSNEVMRLCRNGDVYIRGKLLTEEDIEEFLATLKVSKEKDNDHRTIIRPNGSIKPLCEQPVSAA